MTATLRPPDETGELDDASIIERSWHEPERFAALFDRHAQPIHRYVARRLGPVIADDVVGETFLVAFRQRERYDLSRTDARPWLYGIASNLIGRHRRAEIRAYRALARTGVDPIESAPDTDEVDARLAAAGVERELAAALARLTRGDRDTLLLLAWADLRYDQIATALGIPVGTVRSRLHRSRRKLREALGGTNPLSTEEEPSHE